jgi:hypothetical protein
MAQVIRLSSRSGLDEVSMGLLGVIASFDKPVSAKTIGDVAGNTVTSLLPYLYNLKKRNLIKMSEDGFYSELRLERIARNYFTDMAQMLYPFTLTCDICHLREFYTARHKASITKSRSLIGQEETLYMLFTEGDNILLMAKGNSKSATAFASRFANGIHRIGLWYEEPVSILSKFYEPEEIYKLRVSK